MLIIVLLILLGFVLEGVSAYNRQVNYRRESLDCVSMHRHYEAINYYSDPRNH